MEVTGTVHEIGGTIQVSDKFSKRDLIIEFAENPQYPEFVKLEAQKDKCALLDDLQEGDEVEVSFNLRGRPWTDKEGKTVYFNTLSIWKIVNKSSGQSAQGSSRRSAPPSRLQPSQDFDKLGDGHDDDLPF